MRGHDVNQASLAKKATVAESPKILQLELWREMFSAKYEICENDMAGIWGRYTLLVMGSGLCF